ncbi:MAG: rhodanese/DsbD fusion-like UAGLXU motif selenoprotein, partial [candidate division WOR-3 bacterium]
RLKLDSTRETPEAEAAHREHQVVGLPTVIFIDSSGRERRDLRLTTFEPPDQFLKRLKQVQ